MQKSEGILTLGNKDYPFRKGRVALVAKGVWHRMLNSGTAPLIMVFIHFPTGFEGYFRKLGTPQVTRWKPKLHEEFRKLDKNEKLLTSDAPLTFNLTSTATSKLHFTINHKFLNFTC